MLGPAIIVVVLVIVIPVAVMISGGVAAAIIGHFVRAEADARHEGDELVGLNG